MLRVKSHFWTGVRILREGTLLKQVEPRFSQYVEEVPEEKPENDYADGPPEEVEATPRKLLIHRPIKGGIKGGPALKKVK